MQSASFTIQATAGRSAQGGGLWRNRDKDNKIDGESTGNRLKDSVLTTKDNRGVDGSNGAVGESRMQGLQGLQGQTTETRTDMVFV